jgi:hypothetical protein
MQAEICPGKQMSFNLLPPFLKNGGNWVATSLLYQLNSMMDAGLITEETTRGIINNDGASEYVCWVSLAMAKVILKNTHLREMLLTRLPPSHHHEYADTVLAHAGDFLGAPGVHLFFSLVAVLFCITVVFCICRF